MNVNFLLHGQTNRSGGDNEGARNYVGSNESNDDSTPHSVNTSLEITHPSTNIGKWQTVQSNSRIENSINQEWLPRENSPIQKANKYFHRSDSLNQYRPVSAQNFPNWDPSSIESSRMPDDDGKTGRIKSVDSIRQDMPSSTSFSHRPIKNQGNEQFQQKVQCRATANNL
jgi:hypothetical protein